MEALRAKKKQLEVGEKHMETVPKLIGHIEKVKEEEIDKDTEEANVVSTEGTGEECLAEKDTTTAEKDSRGTGDKSTKSEMGTGAKGCKKDELRRKPRSTPSAAKLKEEKHQVKIKEQERMWKEATEKGLGEPAGDIDVEDAMMSPEEEEK